MDNINPQATQPINGEPALNQPWPGIGFGAACARYFKKYATFSGRASRGEYWWTKLALIVIFFVLDFISVRSTGAVNTTVGIISGIFGLATVIPTLAVAIRRLHDANLSGWFVLLPTAVYVAGFVVESPKAISAIAAGDASALMNGALIVMIFLAISLVLEIVLFALPSKPEGVRFDK